MRQLHALVYTAWVVTLRKFIFVEVHFEVTSVFEVEPLLRMLEVEIEWHSTSKSLRTEVTSAVRSHF